MRARDSKINLIKVAVVSRYFLFKFAEMSAIVAYFSAYRVRYEKTFEAFARTELAGLNAKTL